MADPQRPTPEERAADRILIRLSEGRDNYREVIVKEIRAAVAAERERCVSKIEPVLSALRDGGNSGWVDDDILESIIAAIRAEEQ